MAQAPIDALLSAPISDPKMKGQALRDLMFGWVGLLDKIIMALLQNTRLQPDERYVILNAAGITAEDLLRHFKNTRLKRLEEAGEDQNERKRVLCQFGEHLMRLGFNRDASIVTKATSERVGMSNEDAIAMTQCMVDARTNER